MGGGIAGGALQLTSSFEFTEHDKLTKARLITLLSVGTMTVI